MITGIDTNETEKFISKYDTGEPKTVWKICCLDYKTFVKVGKMSNSGDPEASLSECVKHGLKGVENYSCELKLQDGIVPDEFLNTLKPMLMIELGGRIMQISTLTESEVKNS